ncbi:MAG: hypothetical protein K8F91_08505 [Candidatus Obscuribacterales bacterium]|nr:hypothetical protein [Candidatus Obscuribacterales bacterium]
MTRTPQTDDRPSPEDSALDSGCRLSALLKQASSETATADYQGARTNLAAARQALVTATFAFHIEETTLAMASNEFGATVEALLGARNALNSMTPNERALYSPVLAALETRTSSALTC